MRLAGFLWKNISKANKNIIEFSDYLDCILKAHNLNCFKKYFYFKVFDLHAQYVEYFCKTRWMLFVLTFFDGDLDLHLNSWAGGAVEFVILMFRLAFFYIGYFPIYHLQTLPFYILSIPAEFFLFQHNFEIYGIITNNFVSFWTLACSFRFIFYLLYFKLVYYSINLFSSSLNIQEIKPEKIKWAVQYFMEKQRDKNKTKEYLFLTHFFLAVLYFC